MNYVTGDEAEAFIKQAVKETYTEQQNYPPEIKINFNWDFNEGYRFHIGSIYGRATVSTDGISTHVNGAFYAKLMKYFDTLDITCNDVTSNDVADDRELEILIYPGKSFSGFVKEQSCQK